MNKLSCLILSALIGSLGLFEPLAQSQIGPGGGASTINSRTYALTIRGRVRTESGPLLEPVRIEFWKLGRLLRTTLTNRWGGFKLTFGTNFHSVLDAEVASARHERPASVTINYIRDLVRGGEIRISAPGYLPINKVYKGSLDFIGSNKAGTFILKRFGNIQGTSLSATNAAAPAKARKQYSKALKAIEKKKFDLAESRLHNAVEIYPGFASAWTQLGQIYRQKGVPEKAMEAYSEASKADSQYTPPILGRLEVEVGMTRYEEAVRTAEALLVLDPTLGDAHFYKAVSHYSLGQKEEALRSAQAAVESPHTPPATAHFLLGALLGNKGDYPTAIKHLQLYLTVDQTSARAEQARILLAEMGAPVPKPEEQPIAQGNKGKKKRNKKR